MTNQIPTDPYESAVLLKQRAEEDQSYNTRCIYGEKVFYNEDTKTRAPGHIATEDGLREFNRVSGCCEYHFDLAFGTDEAELPDPKWAVEHTEPVSTIEWKVTRALKERGGGVSNDVLYASRILNNRTEPLCDHHKNAVDRYEDDSLLCGVCDALALEQAGLLKSGD